MDWLEKTQAGADIKGCRRTIGQNGDKARMVMRQMQYLGVRGKHESKL